MSKAAAIQAAAGAIDPKTIRWVLLGVGGLVFYTLWKLNKFGDIFDPDEDEGTDLIDLCNTPPENLSFDDTIYSALADQIEVAIWEYYGGAFEDEEAIKDALMYMNTDGDVIQLACMYGKRGPDDWTTQQFTQFGTLTASVANYLSSDDKAEVNQDYEQKGITFRWF